MARKRRKRANAISEVGLEEAKAKEYADDLVGYGKMIVKAWELYLDEYYMVDIPKDVSNYMKIVIDKGILPMGTIMGSIKRMPDGFAKKLVGVTLIMAKKHHIDVSKMFCWMGLRRYRHLGARSGWVPKPEYSDKYGKGFQVEDFQAWGAGERMLADGKGLFPTY